MGHDGSAGLLSKQHLEPPRRARRHLTAMLLLPVVLIFSVLFYTRQTGGAGTRQSPLTEIETSGPIGGGVKLRIMALGDSITAGSISPDNEEKGDGNGYRLRLRRSIINTGVPDEDVDFIGSQITGLDNPDNQHEGYPNKKIDLILEHLLAHKTLHQHPNLVLIHAGTNDMNDSPPEAPYTKAHLRLGVLIDEVLCQSPGAVVLVSLIIQNHMQPDRTEAYNSLIPQVVAERQAHGHKVLLVDHSRIAPGPDKTQPSQEGYNHMVRNWMRVLGVIPAGWLVEPREPGETDTQTCPRFTNWGVNGNASRGPDVSSLRETAFNWREEAEGEA